ncbi:MAG TPA: hypothetical protein VKP65_22990 [Rhodothermales bacterium]|nr:hypothetical protein [Rhodothermales bacterium]
MTQQSFLDRIQTNERLLKQQAHVLPQDAYEKLVVEHLHLIASLKTKHIKPKQNPEEK